MVRRLNAFLAAAAALFALATPATAQTARPFTGLFAGMETGTQHVIAGSSLAGVDVLQHESRVVTSMVVGARKQFAGRLAIGAEAGFGFFDGAMEQTAGSARIAYRGSRQHHFGGVVGWVSGRARPAMLFGYVLETSRHFDVTIVNSGATISQGDDQGILRFGGGLEVAAGRWASVRGTVGTSRADFSQHTTNIDVGRKVEASIGVLLRLSAR